MLDFRPTPCSDILERRMADGGEADESHPLSAGEKAS
jgi:hypothetical protein